MNEAIIPLPDGRRVPVDLRGSAPRRENDRPGMDPEEFAQALAAYGLGTGGHTFNVSLQGGGDSYAMEEQARELVRIMQREMEGIGA